MTTPVFHQTPASASYPASAAAVQPKSVTSDSTITIRQLDKSYVSRPGDVHYVLKDINLTVHSGEFFILLGPSGCGKSTLLNMIAGFIEKSAGTLQMDGVDIHKPGRDRAVVFQQADASLFPWLSVRQNVEFGLKMKKVSRARRREYSDHYLQMVGLSQHADKYPGELSGGMKQRVQLARVLTNDADILLMDEPFGALDAMTRRTMQRELVNIWRQTGKTIIFVTHDIQEAILLGQRIGIMSEGPAAHIAELYDIPLQYPRDSSLSEFHAHLQYIQAHFDE